MKMKLWKKLTAVGISLCMMFSTTGVLASVEETPEIAVESTEEEIASEPAESAEEEVVSEGLTLPEPYYEFDFDNKVSGNEIGNLGSKMGAVAKIEGSGAGLEIVEDATRGSKVLSLPGNGLNKGYLTLPENMFEDVTEAGFAFSFWVNVDSGAEHYNRIFSASSIPLNSNDGDGGAWNAPEFTFVVGGTDTASTRYNSSIMMSDRSSQMKLVWEDAFARGRWQHVTVSVSPSSYDVYLDGAVNKTTDMNGNESQILSALFADNCAELKGYVYNAIGRSVYSTDYDVQARIDDFRFYNTALTKAQAVGIYEAYEVEEASDIATLHFDASENTGNLLHGSTGFLYGVSEVNVPSADLIEAIQPKILVQKAADGQQHPSGDGYRLTSFLDSCGVENIQIYLQDYYLEWPYENTGIDDYNEKVRSIVTKMLEGKSDEEVAKYSFVLFNEPDGIWYSNNITKLCNDWLTIYDTVKEINPNAKVAGPNYSAYNSTHYKKFFQFCKENDCLPDYVTWHELNLNSLSGFQRRCEEVKGYLDGYYEYSDIEPVIFINETVNFDGIGNPGQLVNWIAMFEEENVYASLPYWGLANSLNELAADANAPNGAWWVYKWYAQMTGEILPLTMENIGAPSAAGRLYGMTSADNENQTLYTLFGGQDGEQCIRIENITDMETFKNAGGAHVKIYRTKFTGHQGFADEIPVMFDGDVKFNGSDLVYTIQDAEAMDAYFAIVTPAHGEEFTSISEYVVEKWQKTYEAENAAMLGAATAYTKTGGTDLARSNRAEVGSLNKEGDGVLFDVEVPQSGTYRLNVYYSSQAPQVNPLTLEYVAKGGQNRAIGTIVNHILTVDGEKIQTLNYDSTVKWGYYNYTTVYLELSAGSHEIQVTYTGENQNGKELNSMACALLDKIDLTYEPSDETKLVVEPEELTGTQAGYVISADAQAAEGSGMFDFYVNAPEEGYYDVTFSGSGSAQLLKRTVEYASDARAESEVGVEWKHQMDLAAGDIGCVYLTRGMNHFALNGNNMLLSQIVFTENQEAADGVIVIEAEDAALSGTDADDDYNYLPGSTAVPTVIDNDYASGGEAVEGFRGGQDNQLSLTVTVPEAGDYKLSIVYSNDEPAPVMKTQAGADYVHPYNTDLVERYAQITVNDGIPETVYFKNTFCWDTFKTVVVDISLAAGKNIITLTNDNSYKFSEVQDDFTPRFDKFTIAASGYVSSKIPTAEKTALQTVINQANGLSEKAYTAESWKALQEALTAANRVLGNADATAAELTSASDAVTQAIKNLVKAGEKPGSGVNYKGKSFVVKGIKYKVVSHTGTSGTVKVMGMSKKLKTVKIPAKVTWQKISFKVTAINKKAFKGEKTIKKLIIGKNVKTIGVKAFYGCKKLTRITVKGTALKTVKKGAFKKIPKTAVIKVKKKVKTKYSKIFKGKITKGVKIK